MDWNDLRNNIQPLDRNAMVQAQAHWNAIGKPLHSLGQLEHLVVKIAGITGNPAVQIAKRCVYVLCADNGVVAEGVTQTDSSVTEIVARNIAAGIANINAMARVGGAAVFPVDIGMLGDCRCENLLVKKVANGTKNLAKEPAMSRAQAEQAMQIGIDLVAQAKSAGYAVIATGEMGIGNTTTSSAVLSVLLDMPPEAVTGRGAGLSDDGLVRKRQVIAEAIAQHRPVRTDALDVLAKVGGLDLAGMTGLFLGGALYRVPIVIDGLISAAAALLAKTIAPACTDYMLPSHLSREPAAAPAFAALGLTPIVHGDLALGEGTGAVTLFPLLDMALSVYHQDTTFAKIQMQPYTELGGAKPCDF